MLRGGLGLAHLNSTAKELCEMARESGWNPLLKSYPFSEKINSVSIGAEVLFCRLIAQADDYGNYYGDPRMILATLFPHRWAKRTVTETDVRVWRDELVTPPARPCTSDVPLTGRERTADVPEPGIPLAALYAIRGVEYLHVINPRRRLRSDVTPEERFPREPATIEEDALSAHVTQAARRRPADVPLTYTLDKDPDKDPDEDKTKKEIVSPSAKTRKPEDRIEATASSVLEYINRATQRVGAERLRSSADLNGRIREGATDGDAILVFEYKQAQWGDDDKMAEYVKPATLFAKGHFADYLRAARIWNEKGRQKIGRDKRSGAEESLDNIKEWLNDKEAARGKRASGSGGNGDGGNGIGATVLQGGDGDLEPSPSAVV
jgi:uncharacterized phage protein (TIGR02220 family)